MTRIVCFAGVFLAFSTFLAAQSPLRSQRFARVLDSLKQKREARLAAYRSLPAARQRTPDNFLLVDISPGGIPIYKAPLNMYAAATTGVTPLQLGELGLSLQGKGMVVGMWDDGQVADHIELGNRVIFKDAAAVKLHSTHISGTLIATGINATAKGMAPLAKLKNWWYYDDYNKIFEQQGPNAVTLSNHSYGSATGWAKISSTEWKWFGEPTISDKEDYRFGFYDLDAWSIDELSNLDPFHLFVWAAGNDRAEVSTGYPKDGNEGTGYDCLIPEAVAKNHIVVGAVYRVTDYTGPASVYMSNFSSWGPTDDGRIKPDLVADGVAVTSLSNASSNAYLSQQGTSMATANVTGSLVLIQELYNRLHGNMPMRSATLRGLAIHTAKEAGTTPGPDYRFGWGLLDVKQAAQTLLAHDDVNVLVRELSLNNQETITLPLQPQAGEKITITLCWTDPAGTSVAPALDPATLMLVNDLDVKLVDEDGVETLPWILNPADLSAAATQGNNFRDNVEKIELDMPLDKNYDIVITHKGTLTQVQPFSIIVTHKSKTNTGTAYYWVGNSGAWSDAAHWSLTSGGSTAGTTPTAADRVIIDDNSFSTHAEETIALDGDATCRSLAWLTSERGVLDMGAHTLTATAMLTLASDTFHITTPGTFKLAGQGQVQLHTNLAGAQLLFESGNWTLGGTINTARLDIDGGSVDATGALIQVPELNMNNNAALDVRGKTLNTIVSFSKSAHATLLSEGTELIINSPAIFTWSGGSFDGILTVGNLGDLSLEGDNELDSIQVNGSLRLGGSNTIAYLSVAAGAELRLDPSQTQRPDTLLFQGTAGEPVTLRATGSPQAKIDFSRHEKICYDYINVEGVDITGKAVVTAGVNSTLTHANGWEQLGCDDIAFPDFAAAYTCAHGLTIFNDLSTGPIESWTWNFGDEGSGSNTFSGPEATHLYTQAGTYTVSLTVATAENHTRTYERSITIAPNTVPANTVTFQDGVLASTQTADHYQWYLNGEALANATGKIFEPETEGEYAVITTVGDCNYMSDALPVTFTVTGTEPGADPVYHYAPNPADRELVITTSAPRCTVSIYTPMGQYAGRAASDSPVVRIDTSQMQEGVYVADLNGRKIKFVVLHH